MIYSSILAFIDVSDMLANAMALFLRSLSECIGTYMGTKWGKVESIEEGVVVVTEELQTVDGQLVVKRQELRLESAGL